MLRAIASGLMLAGLACRRPARSAPPADAALITVYVAPRAAPLVTNSLLDAAARHQWALSLRTDSAALAEADLVIVDSAGRPAARVRADSPVAAQAHELARAAVASGAGP